MSDAPSRIPSLRDWLIREIASRLNLAPAGIDPNEVLTAYGIDSLESASLAAALERKLGAQVPPSFFLDHPSLEEVLAECAKLRGG